jgi:hypothetical protein
MLLMRLRCKDGLEEPPPIVNQANVTNFLEGSNGFTNYWNLLWAVLNFLDHNGLLIAGVNNAFVSLHQNKYPTDVEYRPVFLDKCVNHLLESGVQT